MDLMKAPFYLLDKENTLKILNLNNIPTIELADPKTSVYPIVARKFGEHNGKDITIIQTIDEAIYGNYDYFAKLYSIVEEYRIEVEALSIKKVEKAVVSQAIFNEIPIRTKEFGWQWSEINLNQLPDEWLNIAIRALYVTGQTYGLVKLGLQSNETVIVTDIHFSPYTSNEFAEKQQINFTMGADVEFMLSCENDLLPASTFFPLVGMVGCDERQIEKDSGEYALAEIRPEKADTPEQLFNNIKKLLEEATEMVPYENIEFKAGSMPFSGYQCGGHLHFGIPPSLSLLRALDYYLAIPVAMIEKSNTARLRRRTNHGGLGRFRVKPYGFEYLSLSSWIVSPHMTKSILCLAKLVASHHQELQDHFLFHPFVQNAYYKGQQSFLKQLWKDIKPMLMKTATYTSYETELSYLFQVIEEETFINEDDDIRKNWGFSMPKQLYDQGLIIQIPKRMRLKYGLKEGDSTFVCVGKNMSPAKIQPYPFTFRNPNVIHLSNTLKQQLAIPNDWNPKLLANNGVITLGPIIGILAARPFERQSTYFLHLCKLAQEKQMLVYVFEPQDILWEQKMIKGTSLSGEQLFPFPAVVYDRFFLGGATATGANEIDEIRIKLQNLYNIPFLNTRELFQLTGNKWETHQLLSTRYEEYLPETRLLQHPEDITEMIDQYGEVYLKPIAGAMSLGVIRIIRRPSGFFWFDLTKKSSRQFTSKEELFHLISPLVDTHSHIIQEGIRRKQYKGNNLEIRVYMQKNNKQIWLRTGMVARLSTKDVMTEDSEQNMRVSKIFNNLYPNPIDRSTITNQIANLAKSIVHTVEEKTGPFGELAVDLCIDQYDSIKLLEINGKPDSLFSQIKAYKLRTIAGTRLLNYAASLAGYVEEEKNDLR